MAVRVFCSKPQELLKEIKAAIRDGTVQSWELDKDGDFTRTQEQWKNKAWFRPVLESNRIVFKIIGQKSERMSTAAYASYHAYFIQTLLNYFDTMFSTATATAQAEEGEWIGPQ